MYGFIEHAHKAIIFPVNMSESRHLTSCWKNFDKNHEFTQVNLIFLYDKGEKLLIYLKKSIFSVFSHTPVLMIFVGVLSV